VLRSRVFVGLAALLACLLVGFAIHRHNVNRFVVQGRPLRVWVIEASTGDTNAVAVLRMLGPEVVPGLVHLLGTRESFVHTQLTALAPKLPRRLGRRAAKLAGPLRAVGDRSAAAKSLGLLGPQASAAVPALVQALDDPHPQVQSEATAALGRIGKTAVPALTELLTDNHPAIRRAAAFSLGEMGPQAEGAITALIESLTDSNKDVRASTVYSLAMIGFPAMSALSNVIDHGDAKARGDAIIALMRIRQSMRLVLPPLIKMAHAEDPASRSQALGALGALRFADDAAITTLIEALKDPVSEVRLAAIKSLTLVFWRAEAAVPDLIHCLQDESPGVREWGVKALGEIGPRARAAVPGLRRLENDPACQSAVAEALRKIGVAEEIKH